MFANHPTTEDLESFLRGVSRSTSSALNALVVRHFLADCPDCRQRLGVAGWGPKRLGRLLEPSLRDMESPEPSISEGEQPSTGYDYSQAFSNTQKAVTAILQPDSPLTEPIETLLARLVDLPEEVQIQVVVASPYAHPAVVRELIERSHDARYRDAEQMLHFAHLARLAADGFNSPNEVGDLRLADLRARAWGQYGNALRVLGRPREAQEALLIADRHRRRGTGDPMLHAWLLERKTAMAIFQGNLEDAVELCDEAGEIYQELGERHLLASTLVQKAIAETYAGKSESAVHILNRAIPLIDREEDPHILLAACHNLIRCYIDLDQPEQALLLYSETHELYKEFNDPLILLRAAWQEGQLLRDLGHLRAAEEALGRARNGYVERKLSYEAALVSLELATVYVKLGLVEELKSTVTATIPIFHALRVKLETLASLLQLRQVADQEQQALELIRILSAQIEPLPKLRPAT